MPPVRTVTVLQISLYLLLLECWPRGVTGDLQCYSCKSMAGLPHSTNCVEINEMTFIEQCPSTAKYCKKRTARQENYTVMERTCEEKCLEQTNIKMMSGVTLDTYCCETDLCNGANSWIYPQPVSLLILIVGRMFCF
ncbi:hypothetical protein LSH36_251g00062 [Paralvinella palmiformis]|uniref:UPAR/Ly6 domain-containing protein n=1 Tax=Paralvinella palmiformis TaxID=53620 RepID=A0AAD9JMX5_9ANNE|nr:hypothetical protein LSH36_251g00062 [Paralvinella palmiformis]